MSTKERSTATANVLQHNGKEIDLNNYFETLQPEKNGNYTAEIKVMDYLELGSIIYSLASVCRSAIENTEDIAKPEEISKILEMIQDLIPFSELEFLDKIKVL